MHTRTCMTVMLGLLIFPVLWAQQSETDASAVLILQRAVANCGLMVLDKFCEYLSLREKLTSRTEKSRTRFA